CRADFAGSDAEALGDLAREILGAHVALFDPQIKEVAAAGGLVRRDFLDFEICGLYLDGAADAGQIGGDQRRIESELFGHDIGHPWEASGIIQSIGRAPGKSMPSLMDLDAKICYCFHVSRRKLTNFMRQTKPKVPSQLSQCGGAGTGYGWLIPFLKQMLVQARP